MHSKVEFYCQSKGKRPKTILMTVYNFFRKKSALKLLSLFQFYSQSHKALSSVLFRSGSNIFTWLMALKTPFTSQSRSYSFILSYWPPAIYKYYSQQNTVVNRQEEQNAPCPPRLHAGGAHDKVKLTNTQKGRFVELKPPISTCHVLWYFLLKKKVGQSHSAI